MNEKYQTILGAVALLVGGVFVYFLLPSTTEADLVAAQVNEECALTTYACVFELGKSGKYDEREFEAADCPDGDGGTMRIFPSAMRRMADDWGIHDFASQCRVLGPASEFRVHPVNRTPSCACRKRGQAPCTLVVDGGEAVPALTYGPGEIVGGGCMPKVCVEVFGNSSMPAPCR